MNQCKYWLTVSWFTSLLYDVMFDCVYYCTEFRIFDDALPGLHERDRHWGYQKCFGHFVYNWHHHWRIRWRNSRFGHHSRSVLYTTAIVFVMNSLSFYETTYCFMLLLGNEDNWHLVLASTAVPVTMCAAVWFLLPESPRYLIVTKHKTEEGSKGRSLPNQLKILKSWFFVCVKNSVDWGINRLKNSRTKSSLYFEKLKTKRRKLMLKTKASGRSNGCGAPNTNGFLSCAPWSCIADTNYVASTR